MAYFKIGTHDYSQYVNKLVVTTTQKYKQRENASGVTMVKPIRLVRNIQVGIIPLDASTLKSLMTDLNKFQVTVSFLNPATNTLDTAECIIPAHAVEYYTINAGGTKTKAFSFTCEEK